MGIVPTETELVLEQTQQEHQSDTDVLTMTMEILLEPTSNKLLVDSTLQAGNPVKEILPKLNLPDHRFILIWCGGTCFQLLLKTSQDS
ncbi:hypothetical protein Tco_0563356 [Tanacetum coccineum]